MKEIMTIQVGRFANFVGAHFWNFQDEILGLAEEGYEDPMIPVAGLNMDVLFKVGETRQGRPTYTPRLLSIDSRGSSGAVSSAGTLYGRPPSAELSSITTWHGSAAAFRSEPYEKNKFLQSLDDEEEQQQNSGIAAASQGTARGGGERDGDGQEDDLHMLETNEKERDFIQSLDEGVRFWTDYLKAQLHPSSIYQIPGVWEGVTPFDHYGSGKEVLSREKDLAEELRDRIRVSVEECDHMQGFQCLVDDSAGFSPIAVDLIDDICEEYGKTPIVLFTTRPPDKDLAGNSNNALTQNLHDAVSLARLASVAHVTVPLGLSQIAQSAFSEYLVVQDKKPFHSSAVYAAAINGITLPYRMNVTGPSMTPQITGVGSSDIGTSLQQVSCAGSRRVAVLEAAIPAPALPDDDAQNGGAYNLKRLVSLTPRTGPETDGNQVAEMVVAQGVRLAGSRGPATVSQVHESLGRANEKLTRAGLNSSRGGLKLSHVAISPCPLAIPLPFPCIFSPFVGRHGDVLSRPVVSTSTNGGRGGIDVVSSPVVTRLSTSGAILPYITRRLEAMQRLRLGRATATAGSSLLEDWGFAREEAQELSESLSGMIHAYEGVSGSDSSDNE